MNPHVMVVGCGRWGSVLARRASRSDIPLDVVAVVDRLPQCAEAVGNTIGTPWYGSHELEAAIFRNCVEWAIVALPPGWARQLVCEALRAAGIEQIRVEKPFMEDPEWVDAVGHQTVFAPEAVLFRELVRANEALIESWASYRASDMRHPNPHLDLAVHDVALRLSTVDDDSPPFVVKHGVGAGAAGRRTRVALSDGRMIVLDERYRQVLVLDNFVETDRYEFDSAPDPLGVEFRAWARGEGFSLDLAARAADEANQLDEVEA